MNEFEIIAYRTENIIGEIKQSLEKMSFYTMKRDCDEFREDLERLVKLFIQALLLNMSLGSALLEKTNITITEIQYIASIMNSNSFVLDFGLHMDSLRLDNELLLMLDKNTNCELQWHSFIDMSKENSHIYNGILFEVMDSVTNELFLIMRDDLQYRYEYMKDEIRNVREKIIELAELFIRLNEEGRSRKKIILKNCISGYYTKKYR